MEDDLKKIIINNKPLDGLDNIEDIDHILSEEDLRIINKVFDSTDHFYQIIDTFENALSNKDIEKKEMKRALFSISKILNYKRITSRTKNQKKKRSLLFRLLFELPELITSTKSKNT
jgi:hypothetical protein